MASTSSSSLGESLTPSMNAGVGSAITNSTSIDTSSNAASPGVMVVDKSPSSQNAPTSSSDKKTTKLSTYSEQKDLNSSSRPSVGMEKETSTIVPVNTNESNDNNSQASHLDEDEGDADDDEIVTEEVCSATTIEADVKNKNSSIGGSGESTSQNDEELHDFSSSSASSAASTSSRDLLRKFSSRKTNRVSTSSNNNNIDASILEESDQKLIQSLSPHIPIISSGLRKREHNRRKCSDPMSVKKLPRLRESDEEEDEYDFDFFDDGEDYDEDFGIGRSFEYYDLSSRRSRRKTRSSTRSSGSTSGVISTQRLNEMMAVSGQFGPLEIIEGNNERTSNPGSPLEAKDFGLKLLMEEKERVMVIKSSDGEFETSITTQSNSEYNLKWKNHEAHILSAFEALLQSETFCDVTLVCDIEEETKDDEGLEDEAEKEVPEGRKNSSSGGVKKLKAHRIVLSACSEYFQRIFADNPCKHPVIVLKDFQAWEIQALLDFMYRGEVNVSLERLDILVKSAESLQIRGLLEAIAKLGPDAHAFSSGNQRVNDNHGICDPTDCASVDDYSVSEQIRMAGAEMLESHISPVWDDGALNLSMDMKSKEKSSSPEIPKQLESSECRPRGSRHQRKPCRSEIQHDPYGIIGQPINDVEMKETPSTLMHPSLYEASHLDLEFGFQNSDRHGGRREDTPPQYSNSLQGGGAGEKQQSIFPRRKQARPRRRSGDFVAQDLTKIPSNLSSKLPSEYDMKLVSTTPEQLQNLPNEYNGRIKGSSSDDKRDNFGTKRVELSSNIPIQLGKYREDYSDAENADDPNGISLTPIRTLGEVGGGGALMSRLVHRRPRSSRRFNEDNVTSNPMNLKHSRSSRSNNSHLKDGDEGERVIINEESPLDNRGLDYTTGMNEGNHKKLRSSSSSSKLRGISGGSHSGKLGFPGALPPPSLPPSSGHHLPFLRNWSPNMIQHHNSNATTMTPPPGLHRSSPIKPDMGDSDDGISSAADQCQSPPLSPFPLDHKHLLSNSRHPHEFPLFGLHQDQQQHHRPNLPSSLTFNKHSPPSPSSFFMNPLAAAAAMSLKPLGASRDGNPGGDEPGGDTPSTPPDIFSQPGFPMGLPMHLTPGGHLHVHGIHSQQSKDDRDRNKDGRGGRSGKDTGHRGSPLGWPGLGLGPPPIFGRHRAQHSAPRGGPPRAWSNADLTEALHNVWNKKMTTSQASRIFGIPYNSLLMYVRGKYGKSLKLDLLKKGLDQAMENSQNALNKAASAGANGSGASPSSSSKNANTNSNTPTGTTNRPSSTPNSESTSTLTTTAASPTTNNNNPNNTGNSNSSPPSVKGHHHHHHHANLLSLMSGGSHNERNNNNTPPTGMGHLHPHHLPNHHHHHNKSSKSHNHGSSSHNTNNHSIELPHELPPGFNPFAAASLFGEYSSPFPFASALSHILPQANLVNQQHTGNGGGGGHSTLGLSLSNHSSRKDSHVKSEISIGDEEK